MKIRRTIAQLSYSYIYYVNPADYCTRANQSCEDCSALDVCVFRIELARAIDNSIESITRRKENGIR